MQLVAFGRKVGFSLKLTPWQQGILSSSPVTGNPAGLVPRNALASLNEFAGNNRQFGSEATSTLDRVEQIQRNFELMKR